MEFTVDQTPEWDDGSARWFAYSLVAWLAQRWPAAEPEHRAAVVPAVVLDLILAGDLSVLDADGNRRSDIPEEPAAWKLPGFDMAGHRRLGVMRDRLPANRERQCPCGRTFRGPQRSTVHGLECRASRRTLHPRSSRRQEQQP